MCRAHLKIVINGGLIHSFPANNLNKNPLTVFVLLRVQTADYLLDPQPNLAHARDNVRSKKNPHTEFVILLNSSIFVRTLNRILKTSDNDLKTSLNPQTGLGWLQERCQNIIRVLPRYP